MISVHQNPHATIDISQDQLCMMADLVKKALENALKSLFEPNILMARNVINADKAINSYEIDIDNSTYTLLTIGSLPPQILRSIISIQKINAILERIGDHAVNIAESAISFTLAPRSAGDKGELFDLPTMASLCNGILSEALASFFNQDVVKANKVLSCDDRIDQLNISITNEVKAKVLDRKMDFETALEIIRICKNLERIADLSTNIAEEATFAVSGLVVKHHAAQRSEKIENNLQLRELGT
jgi:phosphate transport system protein